MAVLLRVNNISLPNKWALFLGFLVLPFLSHSKALEPCGKISQGEIYLGQCEQLALDGSSEAAATIAGRYAVRFFENRQAIYWYGIGAENGDLKSRFSQAVLLTHSPLSLDRRRGRFWLRRLSKDLEFPDAGMAAKILLDVELKEKIGKPDVWDFPPNKW